MRCFAFLALIFTALSTQVVAQDPHAGHTTTSPAKPSTPPVATPDPHAGHTMQTTPPTDHTHSEHAAPPSSPEAGRDATLGAELPVGDAAPPAVVTDNAADRSYEAAAMARARQILADEHGGASNSKVMVNFLEYAAEEEGAYRWDLEAWRGGDIHRFVIKTEGDGVNGGSVESAEVQALYSRAVGRYTDIQAGVRYDFEPDGLAYATVGVETLLPCWFDVEAALFLSDHGDAFARFEGSYDLRLTQRLILQPRLELDFSAQNVATSEIGSGLSSGEFGLRLRYDVRRELAPYVGVNFEKSFGQTADFVRAAGEDSEDTSFVIGLRAWF
jgi:copper resistance protein B